MADDTITFLRLNKEENNLQNKLELKKKYFRQKFNRSLSKITNLNN